MIRWVDLRCDSTTIRKYRNSPDRPGICQNLILRFDADSAGIFEVKCGRCKKLKTFCIEVGAVRQSAV
jgi:phage FluMu protein Com